MIPDTGVGMAVIGHMVNVTSARRHILRQCSFSFPTGQCTAILGPNGAGKTTLLGLANGLTTIHSGSVTALGLPVNSRNVRSLRQRIGYVAQWRFIDPRQRITVFESVLSGTYGKLGLFRKPGEYETRLAAEALAAVAASHLATRPLGCLSGGEAQRVAIARALAQEPEILLLDEPTASLDWQARRDILRLVGELKRKGGLTIIMVTHELNAIAGLCDRALLIKNGSVFWEGDRREALQADRLTALFGAEVEICHHAGRPVVLM